MGWAAPFEASVPGAPLTIVGVPAFSDNIFWLIHDRGSGGTVAIDPGDAAPVLAVAEARGWTIDAVWTTHWHADHCGGNAALAARGATIIAPAAEEGRVPAATQLVADGDRLRLGDYQVQIWALPGHTRGHIGYILPDAGAAFVGDTLFVMGCGRLFEGSAAQMHGSLQRLATLDDSTQLYCAHDYSLANARFAVAMAPDQPAIADRLATISARRAAGEVTVPTRMGDERATNLFLRAADADEFARLRSAKDQF